MSVSCDRVVTGGIFFLILFTPFAFGSVHPWAFSVMEAVIFFLVIIWMGKLIFLTKGSRDEGIKGLALTLKLALPLVLFFGLISLQLVPLPPTLLRILSPSTYELYTRSLPGWREKMPYKDLSLKPEGASKWTLLPTPDEVVTAQSYRLTLNTLRLAPEIWLPLSIAPSMTKTDLLKMIAYASLFFLVLLYPLGPSSSQRSAVSGQHQAEERFFRSILLVVLLTGSLVAAMGFMERFSWNGKILWFFVPLDWGVPRMDEAPRASGPFINPDHFANYLLLIFPLALVSALFRTFLISRAKEDAFRILCGLAALVVFSGILLSLSRSGWMSALLGLGILLWVSPWRHQERMPSVLKRHAALAVRVSLGILCFLLILSLFFVGPGGRKQVDRRLQETVMRDTGLGGRVSIWKDTLGMIRDFPLLGVGLGSWPDLFPRYQSPPWSSGLYREAHNDYVELLAETGIIGFGLLAWFFYRCGKILFGSLRLLSRKVLPLFAAFLSALGVMAFHEFFDFNLQIPANAFLFTLFFALALRMTMSAASSQPSNLPASRSSSPRVFAPATIAAVALILLVFSLNQEISAYPYGFKEPATITEARDLVLSHPGRASSHLSLFRLVEDKAPSPWLLNELGIALWLEPTNPYVRDLYAWTLLRMGRRQEAHEEVTRSVLYSPSLSTHFYLGETFPPWLSQKEKEAVEEGFKKALASEYAGAMEGLASFYARLGRFTDEGKLYEQGALRMRDPAAKAGHFLNAGLAYVKVNEGKKAEALFRQAALAIPQDPRPYHHLAILIFAARGDLNSAKAVVSEGIGNGADPLSLYFSLAEAAQRAGNREEEKSALLKALDLRPSSSETGFRLGSLNLQENNFDRAALYFGKAANINPSSAAAFYHLGMAEEGRYQFVAADKAYARALELTPHNNDFQQRYEAFKRRVAQNQKPNGGERSK